VALDPDACFRALRSRDPRFDGVFFVGVTTTGIYCRPVCPARNARRERLRFFPSGAAAEKDGFRACFRCRPERAPGFAPTDATPRLVSAAVGRIAEGALNEGSVEALGAELGVSGRHLRRAMVDQLGVSPVELAQTERLALAKRLLQDSGLGLAELAHAAGFGSVRRFNSAFQARFRRPPGAVRREALAAGEGSRRAPASRGETLRLRLDYRPPLAWEALLRFLAARAIPGVEQVDAGVYRRVVRVGGASGWLSVERHPRRAALVATLSGSLLGQLMPVVARLRRLFDLDARPAEVDAALEADPLLSPLVRATPGLRVPGAFEGFEAAARAVLGQQVTVKGATTLAGRLVERLGAPVPAPVSALRRAFPSSASVAAASLETLAGLGMPGARARALQALARAVEGGLQLEPGADREATLARLAALPGFGPWTTQYVAMRALRWPDAFPAADLGVLQALGVRTGPAAQARAEAWRPWRAYATLHLWSSPPKESR
jgi:AraC family transcriptional regulator of adaptative response / DNA-3-methyladenine glycosylase II